MNTRQRTGVGIIQDTLNRNPGVRLALGCQGTMIGQWFDNLNRFYPIASETITGEWVSVPYAILINGNEPNYAWVEITK